MTQLLDFSKNFNASFGWDEVCYSAELLFDALVVNWSKNIDGYQGIQIEIQRQTSHRFESVYQLGDVTGIGTRLSHTQHSCGLSAFVFYGQVSPAEQFDLVSILRVHLLWLQQTQNRILAAHSFDQSPIIMYQALEIEGRWVLAQANKALADFIGAPLSDFIGSHANRQILDYVHPDDLSNLLTSYDFTRTMSEEMTLQYRLMNVDGVYMPVTERVRYATGENQKSSLSVVWHRSVDQVDSSQQFKLFRELENFTQDISFETGRQFLLHFCRRLDASTSANRILLCAHTKGDWWETWSITENGHTQPDFHFQSEQLSTFDSMSWNSNDMSGLDIHDKALLFGNREYLSIVPLHFLAEEVTGCLIINSDTSITNIDYVSQLLKLFGVRIVREIHQARVANAQVEQNKQLVNQKQQLTNMVNLLGYLDTVADETEFVHTLESNLQKSFNLSALDWSYWDSGEWQKVFLMDSSNVNWYRHSDILKSVAEIESLEQCRRLDDLYVRKAAEEVYWPIGQTHAGYLVMKLSFETEIPDMELLKFSRNAIGLAHQGMIQKENLRKQAMQDSLTGLGNRSQLHAWIKVSLASHKQASLLLFDLNKFKEINDSFGHQFGDKILREIGPRIRNRLQGIDHYLARLGGDEFALYFPQIDPALARSYADMLHAALAESYFIDRLRFQVEASVGVSHFPMHGADGHELLRCADVAMYAAKNSGRGVIEFNEELDTTTPLRIAVLSGLDAALEYGQMWVAYQPLMDTKTGQTAGFEALIRWDHPEYGPLSPAEFIPIAEMGEGIRTITDFVMHNSLRYLQTWRKQVPGLHVAVNISPRVLLDHQFPTDVENMLEMYDLPGTAIIMELTESTLLVDPLRAIEIINNLGALGIKVEIDDFGTGYSSLSYLKSLPISALKIDRSFIADILEDAHNEVIVASTIQMAHSLGLQTVAEGVEDEATLLKMMRLGCDIIQGYYYSKPIPGKDISDWLTRNM